jgi:hypothetical protein
VSIFPDGRAVKDINTFDPHNSHGSTLGEQDWARDLPWEELMRAVNAEEPHQP